eukprot:NODE_66_length_2279_cov_276.512140.p1 GENE.NODE_66_length_2279_cov_276.512140~~NODE_66_length_2279_cov_276.512140.p1  ORF type:complete len:710 (-),score=225.70 NODE_66_length_2279_cov_276.512140:132-2261(-)
MGGALEEMVLYLAANEHQVLYGILTYTFGAARFQRQLHVLVVFKGKHVSNVSGTRLLCETREVMAARIAASVHCAIHVEVHGSVELTEEMLQAEYAKAVVNDPTVLEGDTAIPDLITGLEAREERKGPWRNTLTPKQDAQGKVASSSVDGGSAPGAGGSVSTLEGASEPVDDLRVLFFKDRRRVGLPPALSEEELRRHVQLVHHPDDSRDWLLVKPDGALEPETFIFGETEHILDFYEIGPEIACTATNTDQVLGRAQHPSHRRMERGIGLFMAVGVNDKASYVVKSVMKSQMKSLDRMKEQVRIIKGLDHPNVVRLVQLCEDTDGVHLVTRLLPGKSLEEFILEGSVGEARAAGLLTDVLMAVQYLHSKNVCHRNLRARKFRLDIFSNDMEEEVEILKLSDCGSAVKCPLGVSLKDRVSSPWYTSPEALGGSYGLEHDVWGVGVIMHLLLTGEPPYRGETEEEYLGQVWRRFKPKDPVGVSKEALELSSRLLSPEPKGRPTATEALKHEWVALQARNADGRSTFAAAAFEHARRFGAQSWIKKAARLHIAESLHGPMVDELMEVFEGMDDDKDGFLTLPQLKEGLLKAGLCNLPSDVLKIFGDASNMDDEHKGQVHWRLWLAATLDMKAFDQEDQYRSFFDKLDHDADGKIGTEDLKDALLGLGHESMNVQARLEIQQVLNEYDIDHDGTIDFDEFVCMMRSGLALIT